MMRLPPCSRMQVMKLPSRAVDILSLVASSSTLICCALPALLVSVGAGASLVGLLGAFPQLVWLSENKEVVFILSGFLIALSFWMQKRPEAQVCPTDPELREACIRTKSWSQRVLWASLIIYAIGVTFAFILPAFG